MFWTNTPMARRRKGYALVVASAASALIGIACAILSIRGGFEVAFVGMIAAVAAAAAGNWGHWAFKDAEKLARDIGAPSTHAGRNNASVAAVRRSARLPTSRRLPQHRNSAALSNQSSPQLLRAASEGKRS